MMSAFLSVSLPAGLYFFVSFPLLFYLSTYFQVARLVSGSYHKSFCLMHARDFALCRASLYVCPALSLPLSLLYVRLFCLILFLIQCSPYRCRYCIMSNWTPAYINSGRGSALLG